MWPKFCDYSVLPTSNDNFWEEKRRKLVSVISAESIYHCTLLFLDHILYRRAHFIRDAQRESRAVFTIILHKNICCGYSLEVAHLSEALLMSNTTYTRCFWVPQHTFSWIRQNINFVEKKLSWLKIKSRVYTHIIKPLADNIRANIYLSVRSWQKQKRCFD